MYNLMMVYMEDTWDLPEFFLEMPRFLEHTAEPLKNRFGNLDADAITQLKAMPTLFCYEDRGMMSDESKLSARVGQLTDIQIRYGGLRTTWRFDSNVTSIRPSKLRELYNQLDITQRNWEHTRSHWAIKDVDLYSILSSAGLLSSANTQRPPRVFISYSWDSQEHRDWVISLAKMLRANGVETVADFSHVGPGQDLSAFMEESDRCDRVIVICTENYMHRAADRRGGVGYEHLITTSALMGDLSSNKYVPVIRRTSDATHMPIALRGRMYVDLSEESDFNMNFQALLRDIHDVPIDQFPLGQRPSFS